LNYILDASALIALFKKEKGAEKVKALLDKAQAGKATVFMNIINLIEINYIFYRALGKDKSAKLLEQIYAMPIQFVETIDDIIFSETSRLKATYSIPLGDAVGLATSIKLNGSFVSGDHSDIEKIEKAESISVFWFR
jgi:predicted nucleic acid-binding protein